MREFRSPLTVLAALIFAGLACRAQDLGLTLPGRLTLFRPLTGTYQGAFPQRPLTASLVGSVGYDDNVLGSHDDRVGSGFTAPSLDLAARIGKERTVFTLYSQLGFIAYWDIPGQAIQPNVSLDVTFTHQFNPRLVLGLSSYTSYLGQPNFALAIGKSTNVGNYVYSSNSLSLGYEWTPRFSTATSYTLNATYYQASSVGTTGNLLEHIFAQQFRYLLFPTVTAAAEYRFSYEQYVNTNLDSYSNFALVGADFTLSPRLQLTFRVGGQFETDLFHGGNSPSSPYFESTVTYAYRPLSFMQWYNLYDSERSDISSTTNKDVYRTGLRILHSFGAKLKLGGGVYYSYNHNGSPASVDENDLEATATANYLLTRAFALQASYTFTGVLSDITSRTYYRNTVFVGASFTF
jgi:putative beta-barrel porin BBP2